MYRSSHISQLNLGDSDAVSRTLLHPLGEVDEIPRTCLMCPKLQLCRGGAIDRRMLWFGTLSQSDPYCPKVHGEHLDHWHNAQFVRVDGGPMVHDGYLPTLIFAPRSSAEGSHE
jgi:hypothetical protein